VKLMTTTAPEGALPRGGEQPADDQQTDQGEFERVWEDEPGFWGVLTAVQNTPIGMRFIATAFAFFILGGITALLMRMQLAVPENTFLTPQTYNQLMTMHGTTMMFLFSIPLLQGIGALVLPQMLGVRELPYPRLSAFAYWTTLFGGLVFYSSFFLGLAPDGGWYAYVPLTGIEFSPSQAMDFWLLGLNVAEIGAIAGAMELIIAVLKLRGLGMTISRVPIFAWAMLVVGAMILFAFTPLIVATTLLEFDRKLHTQFFSAEAGGKPLLWQHLFWIFGHPDVYIQFLAPVGIISMIIPVFARRRLEGYTFVALAILATGFISFGLWVHHMFTSGQSPVMLALFSAASMTIAIPSGIQVFAWIATIWNGRPRFQAPFLFALGFLFVFVLGGISGVMVAVVPFDWQVTDSYFIVAHFHYVLIGGLVFPIFAGLYYWWPKYMEKQLSERLGRWNFWLLFVGFNMAFFPMHLSGFLGMARRVYTYPAGVGLELPNLISTVGAFVAALGVLLFLVNIVWTQLRAPKASANPWEADTLEWATPTPTPQYGFRELPVVRGRHPLWDQEDLEARDERTRKLVQAFAQWPTAWRAQIVTTTLDARPQEVFRVPGPSIWPLVAALALTVMSVALIFDNVAIALGCVVVTAAALVLWHWPDTIERAGDTAKADAFEREHGVPVNVEGSTVVANWAVLLTILTLGIGLVSLLYCYFYLRLDAPQWPPTGIGRPNLELGALAAGLLAAGAAPAWWATRLARRGAKGRLALALAASFLLGAGGLAALVADLALTSFRWDTLAYGSAFWTLAGYLAALAFAGLLINGFAQLWAWQGRYSARYHQQVNGHAYYCSFVAAAALAVFATLYGTPYLGGI
jgi:cytochrome c oxidase subunit I+III